MTTSLSITSLNVVLSDPHEAKWELCRHYCQLWCMCCNVSSTAYSYDPRRKPEWAIEARLTDMPHLDALFRFLAERYVANRGNPVGAFLAPAVRGMENAIATRDGRSVYFAQAGDRIKIGCSKRVADRIAQLQTGCPEPIELLGTVPGGVALERRLHTKFDHLRIAGEWFEAAPELVAAIRSAADRQQGAIA